MKNLVFIGGSGRSGSTLLDMLLNEKKEITSLGEIHRLGYYALDNDTCTCGQLFNDCPFWKNIIEQLPNYSKELANNIQSDRKCLALSDDNQNKFISFSERLLLLTTPAVIFRKLAAVIYKSNYTKIDHSIKFYECISATLNTPIIVDNTKDARRLKYFAALAQKKLKVIYLVRDGRAVCLSAMKRKNISMKKAASEWRTAQIKQLAVTSTLNKNVVITIKYEDLCSNPTRTMAIIDSFLGLASYDNENPTTLNKNESHGLGGNPMRFRQNEKSIKLDEKWKIDLCETDHKTFKRYAGLVNKALGYN